MASSSSRRRRRADGDEDDPLEEGELVPGYHSSASDDTDDDERYSLLSRHEEIRPPQLGRRLEEILAKGRAAMLPSPTPSYESCESDGTISDDDGSHGPASFSAGGVGAPTRRVHSCHVCGKGFGSPKALDGHNPCGRHGQEMYVAVSGGCAATGKRGWTGGSKGKAAVSSSDELNHSMATVASEPNRPLQPVPLAFSRSNLSSSLSMASARTNLDSGETSSPHSIQNEPVAGAGANPSNEAFVHQKPAAPPQEAQQAHQVVLQLAPAVPPVQGPAAPRREYTCKICGKSYPTHQGLGGHAAGHMNRRKEAEAAAAAAAAQDGGVIPAAARHGVRKEHKCDRCGKAFPTGVALGGHKRMHYNGPPIVHRKSKKQCVAPQPPVAPLPALAPPAASGMADDGLTLALGIKAGQPSVSPAATGYILRLFGVDIGQEGTDIVRPQAEAPVVQEGTDIRPHEEAPQEGSAMTEGSASAGGQQKDDEKQEKSCEDSLSKESSN